MRGDRERALIGMLVLVGLTVWVAVEGASWAAVDDEAVSWRSLLCIHRVPLEDVVEVAPETPFLFLPGSSPVFRVRVKNGRWRTGPSLDIGRRARYEFVEAIRTRVHSSPSSR